MTSLNPQPFKLDIPQRDLDTLHQKLKLTRLPTGGQSDTAYGEDNGITVGYMQELLDYWLETYDWKSEEAKINALPQFKVNISLDGWGDFDVHYVRSHSHFHSSIQPEPNQGKGKGAGPIPLLYLHGWPGNFTEVTKLLRPLNAAGYSVVAPSLPGFGFSSYASSNGFKAWHTAALMHKLMTGLGYSKYVVAGGDWGAFVAQSMVRMYSGNIAAVHLTNVFVGPPPEHNTGELTYSEFEQKSLERIAWFGKGQSGYSAIQSTKPLTLGFAMHDSPLGMAAWMADKLLLWTDPAAYTSENW